VTSLAHRRRRHDVGRLGAVRARVAAHRAAAGRRRDPAARLGARRRTPNWTASGRLLATACRGPVLRARRADLRPAARDGLGGAFAAVSADLWDWVPAGTFQLTAGLLVDPLSMTFVLLITLRRLADPRLLDGLHGARPRPAAVLRLPQPVRRGHAPAGARRQLPLLFVGWEGVGLASYLLIGFWQHNPAYASAAKKAFVVNRVGDIGLSLAIMLMFVTFGRSTTPRSVEGGRQASTATLTAIGLLLLLGACGKSAQFPLQSWLSTRWRARPRSPHSSTRRPWSPPVSTSSSAPTSIFDAAPNAQLAVASSARHPAVGRDRSAAPRTTSRRRWPPRR
jgi:hypothetical protein